MNKQHEEKNKMNKEEYIKWVSSTCFWAQWPSDKMKDFSKYVNGHPELKIRDFIEIAARGNYPEFLRLIIYKFGASSFTSEEGKALILFKCYQSPAVADIVIQRRISQEALKEYKNQLEHELSRTYNLDKHNLTIAYAKISDAITSKQKGQTMNNTNNEHQEKIYTNRDRFKNYPLDTVLEYVSDTLENINKWLEKPYCVPVEEEDDLIIPKWSDADHWVFDKVTKHARYVVSTSYYLSNVGKVALGFSDGAGWVGKIKELKQRFSKAEVKIGN